MECTDKKKLLKLLNQPKILTSISRNPYFKSALDDKIPHFDNPLEKDIELTTIKIDSKQMRNGDRYRPLLFEFSSEAASEGSTGSAGACARGGSPRGRPENIVHQTMPTRMSRAARASSTSSSVTRGVRLWQI